MKRIFLITILVLTLSCRATAFAEWQVEGAGSALITCSGGDMLLLKAAGVATKATDYLNNQLNKGVDKATKALSNLFKSQEVRDKEAELAKKAKEAATKKAADVAVKKAGATLLEVPVGDSGVKGAVGDAGDINKTATEENTKARENRSRCLDALAYAASRTALLSASGNSANWINKGFNGNPLYITNLDSYLTSLTNQNIKNYIGQAQNADPVFGNMLRSVVTQQTIGKIDGLIDTPLETPQAKKYQSYMNNFSSGGWNTFLNPKYNAMDAILNASNKLGSSISKDLKAASDEVQRNNGFLDSKKCSGWKNKDGKVVPAPKDNGLANGETCYQWTVTVPGSIIKNRTESFTTTDIRQLEMADTMSKSLSSFFDKMINNLITKGLNHVGDGIQNFGDPKIIGTISGGGPGSNQFVGDGGNALDDMSTKATADTGFDVSDISTLGNLLQTQYSFLNATKDMYDLSRKVVPILGQLDYCIPGPNPHWYEDTTADETGLYGAISVGDGATNQPWQLLVPKHFFNDPVTNTKITFKPQNFNVNTPTPWTAYKVDNGALCDALNGILNSALFGLSPVTCEHTNQRPNPINGGTVADMVRGWFTDYTDASTLAYGFTNIVQAFVNSSAAAPVAGQDKLYVKGLIYDAMSETAQINSYFNQLNQVANDSADTVETLQKYTPKLQDIYNQAAPIIAAARQRKNRAMKAQGIAPNEMSRINSCLDTKYPYSRAPIVGQPRLESDNLPKYVAESAAAQKYFYQQLTTPKNIPNPTVPVTLPFVTPLNGIIASQQQLDLAPFSFDGGYDDTTDLGSWDVTGGFVTNGDASSLIGNFSIVFKKEVLKKITTTNPATVTTTTNKVTINGALQSHNLGSTQLKDSLKETLVGPGINGNTKTEIMKVTYTVTVFDNLTGKTLLEKAQVYTAPF